MNLRIVLTLLLVLFAQTLQACPVCFTAPDSPETKGMTLAILFLLGTIGMVVCGVGSFFFYLMVKQKNPEPGHQELMHLAMTEGPI